MANPVKFCMKTALMLLMLSGCASARPEDTAGIHPSPLLSCPESPNCVSTESSNDRQKIDVFRLKGDFSKNWLEIQRIVAALPRSYIVEADKTYIHATFKSRVFGFIDDLELLLNPSSGIISIRSAAQTGYWDFGVNRRRVADLRRALQASDIIEQP